MKTMQQRVDAKIKLEYCPFVAGLSGLKIKEAHHMNKDFIPTTIFHLHRSNPISSSED
jgi:hypothetical protein